MLDFLNVQMLDFSNVQMLDFLVKEQEQPRTNTKVTFDWSATVTLLF